VKHAEWGRNHYDVARALAGRATVQLLAEAMPPAFGAVCGQNLGVLVLTDPER
jgi:hypothetical protein